MKTINIILICLLLLCSNIIYGQFYSSEVVDISGENLEITDFTTSPCNGNTVQVGVKYTGSSNSKLWVQLNNGDNLLNNFLMPSAAAPTHDLTNINDAYVAAHYDQTTGSCLGYMVTFSAITVGESNIETHVIYLDPTLNLVWHSIPYDNTGQHTIVKDCMIRDNSTKGDLLIHVDLSLIHISEPTRPY